MPSHPVSTSTYETGSGAYQVLFKIRIKNTATAHLLVPIAMEMTDCPIRKVLMPTDHSDAGKMSFICMPSPCCAATVQMIAKANIKNFINSQRSCRHNCRKHKHTQVATSSQSSQPTWPPILLLVQYRSEITVRARIVSSHKTAMS